jgi:hypothetical protein
LLTPRFSLKRQAIERSIEARARNGMARLFRHAPTVAFKAIINLLSHIVASENTMRQCCKLLLRSLKFSGKFPSSSYLQSTTMQARAAN